MRIGIGVDVHPLEENKPCFLGGLEIEGIPGCSGHSDGDVIAHALCDAILSAAGVGDLGTIFGTDRPEWKNASGADLLKESIRQITAKGYVISNATVQFVGNTPRIGPLREKMQQTLSEICDADITVIATTTDGLGLTGRGEGRASVATALVRPIES